MGILVIVNGLFFTGVNVWRRLCCSPARSHRNSADEEPQTVVQTHRRDETENPDEDVHCVKANRSEMPLDQNITAHNAPVHHSHIAVCAALHSLEGAICPLLHTPAQDWLVLM